MRCLAGVDVFDEGHEVQCASFAVPLDRYSQLCPGEAAVLADEALFQTGGSGGSARLLLENLDTFSNILRRSELLDRHAGDFLGRVANDFGKARIATEDRALK